MKKILSIFVILCAIFNTNAYAETFTGTVRDDIETLIGANVRIPNTNPLCACQTDTDGNFNLTCNSTPPSDAVLEITYIGYTKQTIPLKNFKSGQTITMSESATDLKEAQVVACRDTDESQPGAIKRTNIDGKCYPSACDEPRYKLTGTGKSATCVEQECKIENGKGKWTGETKKWVCSIDKCNGKFHPSDDDKSCVPSDGPCTPEQLKEIEHATAGELKNNKCVATACEDGYRPSDGKCIEEKSEPEKQEKPQAKLSDEDQKKKIAELEENARAMKEKEQSTTNKMLGAAAIATTGQGLSDTMAASSEAAADKEAEEAMRAYLATFRCSYAAGKNVRGGEVQIELPGGNDLIDLYSQYVNLANNLKVRKAALDMRPGIESETILDSAQTGLYDDVALGKTSGAYASLARALQDPNSEDAKMWAQQKEETASKKKSGMIMAGVGVIGGVAGNLLLNKNAPKERSDEINAKRENITKILDETIKKIIETCNNEIAAAQATATEIKTTITDWQSDPEYADFVTMAESAEQLASEQDIIKLREHPVCN